VSAPKSIPFCKKKRRKDERTDLLSRPKSRKRFEKTPPGLKLDMGGTKLMRGEERMG